jgi:hypothetical protein
MALDHRGAGIVQGRTPKGAIGERKPARLDDVERRSETSRQAKRRAEIGRDVGLIEGEAQFKGSQQGKGCAATRREP